MNDHKYPDYLAADSDEFFWVRADLADNPEELREMYAAEWGLEVDEVTPYFRTDKIRYSNGNYVLNKGDGVEYYFFSW